MSTYLTQYPDNMMKAIRVNYDGVLVKNQFNNETHQCLITSPEYRGCRDTYVIRKNFHHTNITPNFSIPENGLPVYYDTNYNMGELEVAFYIGKESRDDAEYTISSLLKMMSGQFILEFYIHTDYITTPFPTDIYNDQFKGNYLTDYSDTYLCIYKSFEIEKRITASNIIVKFVFYAKRVREYYRKFKTLKDSTEYVIDFGGTGVAYPIITLIPKTAMDSFTYDGITINTLLPETPVIINSENKTITMGGINKFLDTNIVDFPKYKAGEHIINVSSPDVTINIEYYEEWI